MRDKKNHINLDKINSYAFCHCEAGARLLACDEVISKFWTASKRLLRFSRNDRTFSSFTSMSCKFILLLILILLYTYSIINASDFLPDERSRILSEFFPEKLINSMKSDAAPIIEKFGGVNVFSSAQYGENFLLGQVDIGDVFDARNAQNMRVFKNYARNRLLILNVSERNHYHRYALAATRFLREFGYDAALFYPDEFHPVFTRHDDTWMFIREDPVAKPAIKNKYYVSSRITHRRTAIHGGIPMEPLDLARFPQFYIPAADSRYMPYKTVQGETVERSKDVPLLNQFREVQVTDEIKKKREEMGIIPSPLSGRKKLPVGSWMSGDSLEIQWKIGFTFTGNEKIYTWGDCGIYVIPLDKEFWR